MFLADFVEEIWGSLKFFIDYARGKPGTHTPKKDKSTFGQAFQVEGYSDYPRTVSSNYDIDRADHGNHMRAYGYAQPTTGKRGDSADQYGEDVRLTTFGPRGMNGAGSPSLSTTRVSDSSSENPPSHQQHTQHMKRMY